MDIEQLAKRQLNDYDSYQPGRLFAGYSIPNDYWRCLCSPVRGRSS
jgi:hypothetical protein